MGIASGYPLIVSQFTPSTTTAQLKAEGGDILRHASSAVQSSITVGRRTEELRSTFWMIALFRLPSLLSSYAVCVTIQLWLFKLSWPCLRHSLTIKEILPRDSLFVTACTKGNVEEVRQLALIGKGMPSSIDEAGRPMLHVIDRPAIRPYRLTVHSMQSAVDLSSLLSSFFTAVLRPTIWKHDVKCKAP